MCHLDPNPPTNAAPTTNRYPSFVAPPPPESEPRIILIKNASVIDGQEPPSPRYNASVLVKGGIIDSIFPTDYDTSSLSVDLTIDATGLVLCPGFIDMHAHSDLHLMQGDSMIPKITQGITTEVIGQDGIGYAPVKDELMLRKIREQIRGWNGDVDDEDFWSWRTVGELLNVLRERGTTTNVCYLVPQGNLRIMTVGYDNVAATNEQLEEMNRLLNQALDEGAIGMSSGLTYTPGCFASETELTSLCSTLATAATSTFNPYYAPHTRSYGLGVLESYEEMLRISLATGSPLHLTHAVLNFPPNKGLGPKFIDLLESYVARGIRRENLTLDSYPYLPGSTTLSAVLPSWVMGSSIADAVETVKEGEARLKEDVCTKGTDGCHGLPVDFATIEISGIGSGAGQGWAEGWLVENVVGKTVADVAKSLESRIIPPPHFPPHDDWPHTLDLGNPYDIFRMILVADSFATTILQHVGHEENVRDIMRWPQHMGGSDGIIAPSKPHPRVYGTMTRYLGHYARDIFKQSPPYPIPREDALEHLIPHLTVRPARRLGLVYNPHPSRPPPRGLVLAGYVADLVLFDPDLVNPGATFGQPHQPSAGINWVFINGRVVISGAEWTLSKGPGLWSNVTGIQPGEVLSH